MVWKGNKAPNKASSSPAEKAKLKRCSQSGCRETLLLDGIGTIRGVGGHCARCQACGKHKVVGRERDAHCCHGMEGGFVWGVRGISMGMHRGAAPRGRGCRWGAWGSQRGACGAALGNLGSCIGVLRVCKWDAQGVARGFQWGCNWVLKGLQWGSRSQWGARRVTVGLQLRLSGNPDRGAHRAAINQGSQGSQRGAQGGAAEMLTAPTPCTP